MVVKNYHGGDSAERNTAWEFSDKTFCHDNATDYHLETDPTYATKPTKVNFKMESYAMDHARSGNEERKQAPVHLRNAYSRALSEL